MQNSGLAGSTTAPSNGLSTPANTYSAAASATPVTGSNFVYYDSQIYSSQCGIKGTEKISGGGMKANFMLNGDANTNTGGTDPRGLFSGASKLG
jgi:hypothetical protein